MCTYIAVRHPLGCTYSLYWSNWSPVASHRFIFIYFVNCVLWQKIRVSAIFAGFILPHYKFLGYLKCCFYQMKMAMELAKGMQQTSREIYFNHFYFFINRNIKSLSCLLNQLDLLAGVGNKSAVVSFFFSLFFFIYFFISLILLLDLLRNRREKKTTL